MPTPRSRSALAAIALACVIDHAQSSESYRLNWIGDYQTGTWDSDAAENISYDPSTQHVFVASADTGIVKVVGIRDPTRMSEVGTLNVKANLAAYCQLSDCESVPHSKLFALLQPAKPMKLADARLLSCVVQASTSRWTSGSRRH